MSEIAFKLIVRAHDRSNGHLEHAQMASVPDGSANIGGDCGDVSAFHLIAKTLEHARDFLERVAPICEDCKKKATCCECRSVTRQ